MRDAIVRLVLARRDRPFLPEWVHRLDESAIKRVTMMEPTVLDRILPRLSRAANGGRLWMGVAAVLFAAGPKERKAALRGMAALSITSAIVNGPAKMIAQRNRPDNAAMPALRRIAHAPVSSSFPSGHSASAAAFATAASLEDPRLAVPLGALAAAVGVSRVHNGAHYPSDVAAGMAAGVAVALVAKRVRPGSGALIDVEPDLTRARLEPAPGGKGIVFVTNGTAGTADGAGDELTDLFPDADVRPAESGALTDALEAAASERPAALGIAGGDGSINAAAGVALRHDVPLAIVPAGTLNHFARDARIDSAGDTKTAVETGTAATVDVGMIDGKPFLNTASFGVYAQIVDVRERLERRYGKWPAAAIALARVMRTATPTSVEIDGRPRRLWAIFIGNGRYEPPGAAPARRRRLDDGRFDVRMLLAERPWSRTSLVLAALGGDVRRSRSYEERLVERMRIRTNGEPLRIARDGETADGSQEMTVEKAGTPLTVYVPER